MGLSQTLALLGFVVGNVLAACPYADQLASRSDIRDLPDSHKPAIGKRAEGKKGVFYMLVLLDPLKSPLLRPQQSRFVYFIILLSGGLPCFFSKPRSIFHS